MRAIGIQEEMEEKDEDCAVERTCKNLSRE